MYMYVSVDPELVNSIRVLCVNYEFPVFLSPYISI